MSSPTLYVMAGEPGVGKGFVATVICDERDAAHYEADRIRKETVVPEMGRESPQYDREESANTYSTMYELARETLSNGRSAVLDATFNLEMGRDAAEEIADDLDVSLQIVRVTCDDGVVRKRIQERNGVSDADVDVYETIKENFEEITRPHITVDNSGSVDETRNAVVTQL